MKESMKVFENDHQYIEPNIDLTRNDKGQGVM